MSGFSISTNSKYSTVVESQTSDKSVNVYLTFKYSTHSLIRTTLPMREKIFRISEFVPISGITLIQWGIDFSKFVLLEY